MTANKKLSLFLLGVFLCCSNYIHSQNIDRYLSIGDGFLSKGDVYNAALNYAKYLEEDPTNKQALYNYANTLYLLLEYKKAKNVYQKLYKRDRGVTFPDAIFWLAMVQKNLEEYDEAKVLFEKYAKRFQKKGSYLSLKSKVESEACTWAISEKRKKSGLEIIGLDTLVNSPFSEFSAIKYDSLLYFSSSKESIKKTKKATPHTSVYVINTNSKKTLSVDTIFNQTKYSTGNISFSADGNSCFFTRCSALSPSESRCAIYFSKKEAGKWSRAIRLNDTINQPEYSSTHPSIARVDSLGEVLFYASNRLGGEGKMDLWGCKVSPNGKWGIPFNLGKKINSMDNEITPFFNDSLQQLFFSSDWHKGMGGFDIFKSQLKNGLIQAPENLGYPVNSSYNDLYYSTNSAETKSYFSSNRIGSQFNEYQNCCNDIYYFEQKKDRAEKKVTKILAIAKKDTVVQIVNQLKLLVPLTLYFENDEPDNNTLSTTTSKTYTSTFNNYLANIGGYKKYYAEGLKKDEKIIAESEIEVLFSDSIEYGMQQLEKFSRLLSKILPEGEQVVVTLKGYCSALASNDYNKNLAKRRIACLKNYFLQYNNGELLSYVTEEKESNNKTGSIRFVEEEIGELIAGSSDDVHNKRQSVYSPKAALERKIQIIAISSK